MDFADFGGLIIGFLWLVMCEPMNQ